MDSSGLSSLTFWGENEQPYSVRLLTSETHRTCNFKCDCNRVGVTGPGATGVPVAAATPAHCGVGASGPCMQEDIYQS